MFVYGEVKHLLRLYRGKDCMEVFCNHIREKAKRLYHMFPKKSMEPLMPQQCREFNRVTKCHICFNDFEEDDEKGRNH